MVLSIEDALITRGSFSLHINGIFPSGIHLITGKTGSGKTTLAEALIGRIVPEIGTIKCTGISKKMLAMQAAERHVTTSTVTREIASFGADRDKVLFQAGLRGYENRQILSLSRGELKKLILMCILTSHFELIILDEPYAGLDCTAKKMISDTISNTISDFKSDICIILTHDLSSLPPVDYLWEIKNGKLVFLGQMPDALFHWNMDFKPLKYLLSEKITPANIDQKSLMEAACRIRESVPE